MDFLQKYLLFIFFFVLIAGYDQYKDSGSFIGDDALDKHYISFAEFTFLNDVPDFDDLNLEAQENGFNKENYKLVISYHPNSNPYAKNVMITAKSNGSDLSDIQVFETGTLSGVIVDQEGHPISDVMVQLYQMGISTYTDENGHFLLEDIPPGEHLVQLKKEGYFSNRLAKVSVLSSQDLTIDPLTF